MDPTRFYVLQLACHLAWAFLVVRATKRHLHELTPAAKVVRPPWLPRAALLALHRHRRAVFAALPVALLAGALLPPTLGLRGGIALVVSAYHLAESSATGRHGEYPLLYVAWAMWLPAPYASAASLGATAHFVLCAGVAKLRVGGLRGHRETALPTVARQSAPQSGTTAPRGSVWFRSLSLGDDARGEGYTSFGGWPAPSTMATYLRIYGASTTAPPLSRRLNRAIVCRPWATRAIGEGYTNNMYRIYNVTMKEAGMPIMLTVSD